MIDIFEEASDRPWIANIKRWIENDLLTSIEQVRVFDLRYDMAEVLYQADGTRWPKNDVRHFVALDTGVFTVEVKDGTTYSVRFNTRTNDVYWGEIYKTENRIKHEKDKEDEENQDERRVLSGQATEAKEAARQAN